MKKTFLTSAALLLSLLAHSQEADDLGSRYAEVTLVARAEYSSVQDDHLGNSSFYALLDGAFSSNLSYSVATHLLSSCPGDLYSGTLYSNTTNWLDWAYLTYDFGQFQFELGKDCIALGTFEFMENDFDCYYELQSPFWSMLPCYQWGAMLYWTPSDVFELTASMNTSPYGEKPFASGLYSYNLRGAVTTDVYEGLYGAGMHQVDKGDYIGLLTMGHRFNLGDNWQVTWDSYCSLADFNAYSTMLSLCYSPSDAWRFIGLSGFDNYDLDAEDLFAITDGGNWHAGLLANWYPIESLRVHALAAYDSFSESPLFNLGLTWQITL